MAFSTETSRVDYNGNNSTTIFPVTFPWLKDADIAVTLANTLATPAVEYTPVDGVDYELTGAGNANGSLTFPLTGSAYATLPTGWTLTIRRVPVMTQESDLKDGDGSSAEVLEAALDRAMMATLALQEQIDRAIMLPISSTLTPADYFTTLAGYSTSAGASAALAAAYAARANATSTSSLSISVASRTFVTQADKLFDVGSWVVAASSATPSKYMHGQVTAYSGTSLTVNVTDVGGSGTYADWVISLSGTRGAVGATGAAGAGTGDMTKAENLAGLSNVSTAVSNLGAGNAFGADFGTTAGTVASGADPRFAAAGCPVGSVIMMAGETVPTGYLECNGAAVSRTTYSALFTAIGVRHGQGDGTTTFNLPYTPGLFPRGWDHGAGNDPDVATRTAAATGGVTGDHVGSLQGDELKAHTHTTDVQVAGAGGYTVALATSSVFTALPPRASGSTGGAETRGKNFMVMFCIKY